MTEAIGPADISYQRDRTLSPDALFDMELTAIAAVEAKYLARPPTKRMAPFTVTWCQRVHSEMFGATRTDGGQFRNCELTIGIKQWWTIEARLQELLDNLHYMKSENVPLEEQAARLHSGSVEIHPFRDGNGRWARTLTNIWIRQQKGQVLIWPSRDIHADGPLANNVRDEYIRAVKAAEKGDLDPLIAFHRACQCKS
ncbi:MAG: Fic family protein [Planctomycetaceae bacterium]|nr:Fic family protein [Planctomycetaceae bacterium]